MTRPFLARLTIRRQLAALALVVALPLLLALAYGARQAHQDAGERAARTSTQLAALSAASAAQLIADSRARLETLARRPLIRLLDPERCDPILREALAFNPYAANLNTVGLDGQVVCSAHAAPPGGLPSAADMEWFQRVRASGRFTVSEPFVGRITKRLVSVLILPIVVDGRRIGYVDVPLDLLRFQAFFAQLAGPSQALVTLVSESGTVVARSLDAESYVGTRVPPEVLARLHDPPSTATGIDNVERIYARAPVPGTNWVVSSGMPTSVAYAASDRLLTTLLLVSAALLALALIAATMTGRWIAEPVQRLARRAQLLAEGKEAAEPAPHGPREVAAAARRLDELVAELGETERRLGHALEAAGMGAWSADLESGRVWRSARHDRIFGHEEPVPDWDLQTTLAHVVDEDRDLFAARLAAALETGVLQVECRILGGDGVGRSIHLEGQLERGEDGAPLRIGGTVADVSERVRLDDERGHLEEQLRQSQKMEAVGQLAGGIAHDFNNLLTAICGYSDLALGRLEDGDADLRGDLEEIARAGEHAAQLTRQLLAFSRRQTLQTTVFDLNEAVTADQTLLLRLLGEHIDIRSSLDPDGCPVEADRGQIEQILMNLAVNARDAMPDGGTLRIRTERVRLDGREAARRFDAPAGEYALLGVSDDGAGMDDHTRAHAFEPFFTTKPLGDGTGLGLATVFGIVRQCNGFISLASEPGAGATFEILLPLARASAAPPDAPSPPGRIAGTERILLVEDDPVVRALAREILVAAGYDVLAAADGEEALAVFGEQPVDLVLTDVVMPKLNGTKLVAELRRRRPELPVVLMSGYAYDAGGSELTDGDTFIQKPFSPRELAAIVRAKLDAARAQPVPNG